MLRMGRKIATVVGLLLLVAVPQADLLACANCSVSPENSKKLDPVSHLEDDCQLQDGFERDTGSSEQDEPIHIHFCVLHSTFLALSQKVAIYVSNRHRDISLQRSDSEEPLTTSFYRPPRLD